MKRILSKTEGSFITTCKRCGTTFEYDKEDLFPDKFNSGSIFNYVCCPRCNNIIPHNNLNLRVTTESL